VRRGPGGHAPGTALRVVLALGLAACATTRPAPAPPSAIAPDQVAELTRRWAAEWEAFPGLRGAVDLTVKNGRTSQRTAAVLLLAPTALRIEIATPFGLPALVGAATPDGITIFRVLERQAQVGPSTPETVAHWLGLRLTLGTLIRLLVGNVPPPGDPHAVTIEHAPSPHLVWSRDGVRHQVWVSAQGHPARLILAGGAQDALTAEYERSANGDLAGLRLTAPARGTELTLRYLSAELVALPPEAFHLALPADVRVQPFD
jgi:hypothetical protein